ncbi:hypothetical protein [Marinivivus vitaminiproducens]|uniref:hypothetical protein n=1 Tax=Marinivivus vitaminiproducens TaxID=3035935 RepID=UPI0027A00C49|nr:hypothetical protein P4R82_03195 [Geminicoccaceae bacterium SCSIO 64248]
MTVRRMSRTAGLALLLAGGLGLAGCADSGDDGQFGLGTYGGAAGGALLGGALAHNGSPFVQAAAMVGGAVLGGMAGDKYVDAPRQQRASTAQQQAADEATQRQLAYEKQSQIQKAEVDKKLKEQALFEQWKQDCASGKLPTGSCASPSST